MPYHRKPLITGSYYHIFNRGVDRRIIYNTKADYKRALLTLEYYLPANNSIKLGHYLAMTKGRQLAMSKRQQSMPLVSILSYCLMPNHFHLLLRQEVDNGIASYMSLVQNSYTQYFNNKHQRSGRLFQSSFKSVMVESREQLLHLSRYIHLNPYVARIVNDTPSLLKYPYSSMRHFTQDAQSFVETDVMLSQFRNKSDYTQFVIDYASCTRSLKHIDHLIFDDQASQV